MTDFDDRFADRVREVFDGHEETVDEAAWARVQAALSTSGATASAVPGARPAPDRPPVARAASQRTRMLAVLAVLVVVFGAGAWRVWQAVQTSPDVPDIAMAEERETVPSPVRPQSDDGLGLDAPVADAPLPEASSQPPATDARDLALASPRPTPRASNELATASPPSALRAVRQDRAAPEASGAFLGESIAAAPDPARERTLVEAQADRSSTSDAEKGSPSDVRDAVVVGGVEHPPASAEAPVAPTPLVRRQPEPQALVADAQPRRTGDGPPPISEGAADPRATERTSRLGLVLATNAAFSGRQLAEGVGVTGGVSGEWRLGRGLSVSTGAQAAYTTLSIDESAGVALDAASFAELESSPTRSLDIVALSTLSTLALEVPLDLRLDLARVGRGRVRTGVGLTTSLYLAQSFRDEGRRISLDPASEGSVLGSRFSSDAFSETETEEPFSRFDLARQMNLSLGYSLDRGRVPLALDAYTRLPLGGVTSRDLPLTSVGVRLRVGL